MLEATRNEGAEKFVKPFRLFCEKHGWDWFEFEPKRLFDFNALQLAAAYGRACYSEDRLRQLREGNLAFWVFHAGADCPAEHIEFDGVALLSNHGFWARYFPPLGWSCGCYVVGAASERGVSRLGGDPRKKLPGWWCRINPKTELPFGVEEPWSAPGAPDLLFLLAAMVEGHSPQPDFG